MPGILVSGSSEAGLSAAAVLGALAVKYPQPAEHEPDTHQSATQSGIRVGIVARESAGEAWKVAHLRFPEDRKGQITHKLAMKTSDSVWHKQLSELAVATDNNSSPYWLWPL